MSNKILITGGGGFIGLHLTNRLLDEGCEVHIVDNFTRAVKDEDLKNTLTRDKVSFSSINLLDKNSINNMAKDYDVIFHLAAIIGVTHVLEQPYNVLYDNIRMLGNIIEFSRQQFNLSRLFFASTSEVYAGSLKYFDLPIPTPEGTPLAITDLAHPRTSYMLSKIYGEALCQQSKIPFTVFRPHNIYGPRMGMAHVIPEQLRKIYNANDGDSIDVFSVNHTRCFCYIDDAIEMLWLMMKLPECEGKTMNLGTQNPEVSIKKLVETCFFIAKKDLLINPMPDSSGSPVRRGPDMYTTSQLLNFESQFSLKEGIGSTYDWYQKNIFDGKGISAK